MRRRSRTFWSSPPGFSCRVVSLKSNKTDLRCLLLGKAFTFHLEEAKWELGNRRLGLPCRLCLFLIHTEPRVTRLGYECERSSEQQWVTLNWSSYHLHLLRFEILATQIRTNQHWPWWVENHSEIMMETVWDAMVGNWPEEEWCLISTFCIQFYSYILKKTSSKCNKSLGYGSIGVCCILLFVPLPHFKYFSK